MFRLLSAALAALPLLASATPVSLEKRGTAGRATYYQTGMGACGQWNNPGDFIVAMNSAQYGSGYPSPNCFRGITISYNGKTAHATVVDECPYGACNYGDIDMSQGLFEFFEPTSVGVFYVNWEWDGEGGAPAPAPQPAYTPPAAVDPPYVPPAAVDPPYVPPAAVDPPYVPPAAVDPPYVPPVDTSNNNNNVNANNVPPPADPTTTSTSSTPAPTDTTPVVNAAPNPDPAAPSSSSTRASSSSRPASSSAANNGAGNVAVAPVDGDTNGAASVTASVTLALGAVSALFALL